MQIKEVEQRTGITKANIRFYEKEGLLSPARQENKYREYSEEDIQCLRRVVLLRKLGVPLPEIKEVFDGGKTLQEVIQTQQAVLAQQIEELNGALEICQQMEKDEADIRTLNDIYYLELIEKKEKAGLRFNEILQDWLEMEKTAFYAIMKYVYFHDVKESGVKWTVIIILLGCIMRGIGHQFIWQNGTFLEGFLQPFVIFAVISLILFPLFLLKRKSSNAADVVAMILVVVCLLFLLGILLFLVVGILNSFLHFLW